MNPGFGIPKYRVLVPGAGLLMFLLAGCFNSEMKWEQIGPVTAVPAPTPTPVAPVHPPQPPIAGGVNRIAAGRPVSGSIAGVGVKGTVWVAVPGGQTGTSNNNIVLKNVRMGW